MARVVLFDRELHEALTVVDVPHGWIVEAESGRRHWRLPVPTYISVETVAESLATAMDFRVVTISLERVVRGRNEHLFWYAYPDDPELALELRAAFLPGQLREVRQRERDAFWRGVFAQGGVA